MLMGDYKPFTNAEIDQLALAIVARRVAFVDDWLEWEDYPEMSQHVFDRLVDAVGRRGAWLLAKSRESDLMQGEFMRASLLESRVLMLDSAQVTDEVVRTVADVPSHTVLSMHRIVKETLAVLAEHGFIEMGASVSHTGETK
ncbi:MAG: hypothetical protein U5Q03_14870 [Bacteroidota bacterium]|nr:hypothetical protein [Bacteroidota bacterium]